MASARSTAAPVPMRTQLTRSAMALALACASAAACDRAAISDGGRDTTASTPVSTPPVTLTGAGATFPYPLYSRWISAYLQQTGVQINYRMVGSHSGARELEQGRIDFATTESPTDGPAPPSPAARIAHIPNVLGAVVLAYNIPGLSAPLALSGETVADIYLGRITRWDDTRIGAPNPGARLPDAAIVVVHRADGSGTTAVFTEFLSETSRAWRQGPGQGITVRWPVGVNATGSEGVAGEVKQTPGAIGYVELTYAKQSRLPFSAVRNADGAFVLPTAEAVAAAASNRARSSGAATDATISLVNAPGRGSYPLASFSWFLIDTRPADAARARALLAFLRWTLHDGQRFAPALDYVPLPSELVARLDGRLDSLAIAIAR
ncbi:MAG: phosphate ABC transporter substrate-binding protein PstS [Gemmatimonadaceae bacterium]